MCFCGDVCKIVGVGLFDEIDGAGFLGVSDHGVAWGDLFDSLETRLHLVPSISTRALLKTCVGPSGEAEFTTEDAEAKPRMDLVQRTDWKSSAALKKWHTSVEVLTWRSLQRISEQKKWRYGDLYSAVTAEEKDDVHFVLQQ